MEFQNKADLTDRNSTFLVHCGVNIFNLMLDKNALSERDICSKFITPAIEKAGRVMASINELAILSNLEILNSILIKNRLAKKIGLKYFVKQL